MREFTIHKNDADQRLDRFLLKAVPLLPASLAQKYIRLKRIKVNGARAERDYRLREGDRLQLYLNDEFFEAPSEENVYLTIANPKLHILYEDENILLLDKPAGLVVHADEGEKVNTLVNHMLAYLYQKREWKPREENAFTPALCNRIDRNTGGIVIAAKNAEALRIMVAAEVIEIAQKKGIPIETNYARDHLDVIKAVPPRNKPSTLQDILAGRKTEVDIFAGAVIRLGKEYGVPTPYNEFLYHAIRVLEAKNAGTVEGV